MQVLNAATLSRIDLVGVEVVYKVLRQEHVLVVELAKRVAGEGRGLI
jgi:hypothetical protein